VVKNSHHVRITTENMSIDFDKIVVAAGRWVLDLFPELRDILHVTKQYLTYFKLQDP
jgi:hypothetical protein